MQPGVQASPKLLIPLIASVAAAVFIHLSIASLHAVLRSIAAPDPGEWSWTPLAVEGHLPGGATPEWAQRLPHDGLTARAAFLVWASLFYVTPVLSMTVIALRGWRDFAGLMMLQVVLLWTADLFFALAPSRPPWMDLEVVRIMESQTDGAVSSDANPFAAVPSLHVAVPASYAAWFAWHPVRTARALGAALWCWTAVMAFVVVFSGEHYLLDVVTGTGWALASYAIVRRLGWAYRGRDRKTVAPMLASPARASKPDAGRRAA